jgi:Cu(I)/Ag(I) efflux system periplasmic protein CusF
LNKRMLTNVKSTRYLLLALTLLALAGPMACNHARATKESAVQSNVPVGGNASTPAATVETQTYQGVGVLKSINLKQVSVEIAHEDIKDLMPAMTMEFYVKDKSLLAGIKSGDRIEFTLVNGVGGLKITAIKKV